MQPKLLAYSHGQKAWNINSSNYTTIAVLRFLSMTILSPRDKTSISLLGLQFRLNLGTEIRLFHLDYNHLNISAKRFSSLSALCVLLSLYPCCSIFACAWSYSKWHWQYQLPEYFRFEMFISAAFYLYLMFTPAAIFLTIKKDNYIFYNASNFLPLFVNHLGLLVFASNLKYLGSTK